MNVHENKLRVLVAEDNPLTRYGTVMLIDSQTDMKTVAEADDGEAAVRLFRQETPDVVVMDLRMPGMGGVEATRVLCTEKPPARVLVLSYYDGENDVVSALRAGALGYVTKGVRLAELLNAIRQVARGEMFLPPEVMMMSLLRSVILSRPFSVNAPMSPVWSQPSRIASAVRSGLLR